MIKFIDHNFPQAMRAVDMWTSPDTYMPQLFAPNKVNQINRDMRLGPNGLLTWHVFDPLYNTVILSKLVLLDARGLNELARRAGVSFPVYKDDKNVNIMLYVMKEMDGSIQWEAGKDGGVSFALGFGPQAAPVQNPKGYIPEPVLELGKGNSGFLFWSNMEAREKVFGRIFKGYGPGPGPLMGVSPGVLLPQILPAPKVHPGPQPAPPGKLPLGVRPRGTESDQASPEGEREPTQPETQPSGSR